MRKIHLVVLLPLLAACSTPKPLKELDLGSNRWSGTAMLLNYELSKPDEEITKTGCSLYLHNLTDGKEYHVGLEAGRKTVLFEAPTGEYESKLLYCSSAKQWSLERFMKNGVKLVSGKINYVGQVTFRFTDDGSGLNVQQGERKENAQALLRNFNEMHPAWARAVVSAYTRRPITKAMLASGGGYQMKVAVAKTKDDTTPTDGLLEKLKGCEAAEAVTNPMPVGVLSLKAKYEGAQPAQVDVASSEHSFSEEFPKCIEEALKGFKPSGTGKIEIAVSF